MSTKKVIVVVGATGQQGGSVVDALLKDGNWEVRGLTRDTNSQKAKELASKGVKLFKADLNEPSSFGEAFKGAYGVFALTNFWDSASMGKEEQQGRALVDAAKTAGVQHFVWSTLENVEKVSKGKWEVPHFTHKAKVNEYLAKSGIKNYTLFVPAAYMSSMMDNFLKLDENGVLTMSASVKEDKYMHLVDINDTGVAILNIFKDPAYWNGKFAPLWGSHLRPQEFLDVVKKTTGFPTKYVYIPTEVFEKFPFPGAKEFAHTMGWWNDYGYYGPDIDTSLVKKLHPTAKTVEQYIVATKWAPKPAESKKQ